MFVRPTNSSKFPRLNLLVTSITIQVGGNIELESISHSTPSTDTMTMQGDSRRFFVWHTDRSMTVAWLCVSDTALGSDNTPFSGRGRFFGQLRKPTVDSTRLMIKGGLLKSLVVDTLRCRPAPPSMVHIVEVAASRMPRVFVDCLPLRHNSMIYLPQ